MTGDDVRQLVYHGGSSLPPDYVEKVLLNPDPTVGGGAQLRDVAVQAWNLGHAAGVANAQRSLERVMASLRTRA